MRQVDQKERINISLAGRRRLTTSQPDNRRILVNMSEEMRENVRSD